MGLLAWLIIGLLAGWLASVIMGTSTQQGMLMDLLVGLVGALIGGMIMNFIGGYGLTGFNLWSFTLALFGSILLLGLRRAFA